MRFSKWHGLGNDYLILEAAELPGPVTPELAGLLCDRHRGVGGDGLLVVEQPTGAVPGASVRMRVINPDGSEAEMCGNGIRMFALYMADQGRLPSEGDFVVETLAGPVIPRILEGRQVRVDMGTARFVSANIDLAAIAGPEDAQEAVQRHLQVAGGDVTFTFVDVGNPHCVIVVDDPARAPLTTLGPMIENLPLFPHRTNVEMIRAEADGSITMRVWERGVGETQACGTGATAVGAAGVKLGIARSPVTVHLLGGDLVIEVEEDWRVFMTGPAVEVFRGEASPELLRALEAST